MELSQGTGSCGGGTKDWRDGVGISQKSHVEGEGAVAMDGGEGTQSLRV
jgi:hypothetical protein